MKKVLITGATGNIGRELVRFLAQEDADLQLTCAVQDIGQARKLFADLHALQYVSFDFEDQASCTAAFEQVEILFLLRPPHISQVDRVFRPLLQIAKNQGIRKVVFLSVQGVENSSVIPHHKIEKLIQELEFEYIFVRPGYFMQNLITSLLPEIREESQITLPAGRAKFNWIDARDIGEAAAKLIADFDRYKNKPYVITGSENLSFEEVCQMMSEVLERKIHYRSINPIHFFLKKKKEGLPAAFAGVMTILHFLPRLQTEPQIHPDFEQVVGRKPTMLREFLEREKLLFLPKG
ncbi:NmrA family NAD(P)-binding protein [Algoriphagus namhaensis]